VEIPIHWELSETDGADESAAILTVRRLRAVDFFRQSHRDWNANAYLYQWLTFGETRDSIARRFSTGASEHSPRRGPVWIWVLGADRRSATEIHVHMCSDTRWLDSTDRPGDLPRGGDGTWQTYTVKLVATRGGTRWLVDFVDDSRITDRGDRYDRCDEWASHERGEGR
jgi:hypothetical protein